MELVSKELKQRIVIHNGDQIKKLSNYFTNLYNSQNKL
jgi:hypothetical protein